MFNVYLKNGEKRWVDKHEVRMLQNKGQIVCLLEIKDKEDGTEGNLFYCDIKQGFCDVHPLVQHRRGEDFAMYVRDQDMYGM